MLGAISYDPIVSIGVGPIPISPQGIFTAVGLAVGASLLLRDARARGFDGAAVSSVVLASVLGRRAAVGTAAGVLVIAAAACSGASRDGSESEGASSRLGASSADTARGATLYETSCAQCHGSDLEGTDRGPSHLSIVYEPNHHGDNAFAAAIANGARQHHWDFGDMPPIEGLSGDDVADIVAFVRQEQEERGFQ